MAEIDLTYGCITRELTHAIETGTAQAFGEAVAQGMRGDEGSRVAMAPGRRGDLRDVDGLERAVACADRDRRRRQGRRAHRRGAW